MVIRSSLMMVKLPKTFIYSTKLEKNKLMAVHPNPDRNEALMAKDHGTMCLITDPKAERYLRKARMTKITTPPIDRYSRPCGGKGGFDDFVERWHE